MIIILIIKRTRWEKEKEKNKSIIIIKWMNQQINEWKNVYPKSTHKIKA